MKKWWLSALAGAATMVFLVFPLAAAVSSAPAGTAADGKAFWEAPTSWCSRCHGGNGEGGYGPDLAGRSWRFENFAHAIRKPWGVMPAYTTRQVSDQDVADMVAYFNSLPPVAEPGPWRTAVPPGAPLAQQLAIETAGCGQCHGATLNNPRRVAGEVGGDLRWFEEQIYFHTVEWTGGRMGDYSKARLPENMLKTIWTYFSETLGLRVPVDLQVKADTAVDRTTYTLTMLNRGALEAAEVFVTLKVPEGTTVSNVTTPLGTSYQGLQQHASSSYQSAVWLMPRISAKERVGPFAIEVQGANAAAGSHAWVRWLRPTVGGDFAMASSTDRPMVDLRSVARGGVLYDRFWTEQRSATPRGNQPLFALQSTNTTTGSGTWRCKECHGWDYLGKDGAYGSGSRYTGFAGVYDARTKSVEALTAALNGAANSQHNFTALIGAQSTEDLVNFLRSGLIVDRDYIDYATKRVKVPVDLAAGKTLYNTTCAPCHGKDGKGYNFGTAAAPIYLGTISLDNPQEVLHKTRFGQPGTTMPSAIVNGWSTQQTLEVLAYMQTLPTR